LMSYVHDVIYLFLHIYVMLSYDYLISLNVLVERIFLDIIIYREIFAEYFYSDPKKLQWGQDSV
jgi:hypothetical protein